MDQDRLILPAIIIIVIIAAVILIVALAGNNTFNSGNLYFEYPNSWDQDHVIGDFSNNSLYSELTLTANIPDENSQTSYIIIQMQKKSKGTLQLPGTNTIAMNTTNSTVGSINIGNFRATQLGAYGPTVALKVTIIDEGNYYYILEYICPPNAVNQTEKDYNSILQTLKIQ